MTIHHAALARMLPAEKRKSYYDSWRNQACRPAAFPSSKRIRRRQSRCRLIRSGCGFCKNTTVPPLTTTFMWCIVCMAWWICRCSRRHCAMCKHATPSCVPVSWYVTIGLAVIDDASSLVLDTVTLAAQAPTSALDAVIQQVINTRFDLARGPLWG